MSENNSVLEIKASPDLERVLSEQMQKLPQAALNKSEEEAQAKWNVFGLISCCYSEGAEEKK